MAKDKLFSMLVAINEIRSSRDIELNCSEYIYIRIWGTIPDLVIILIYSLQTGFILPSRGSTIIIMLVLKSATRYSSQCRIQNSAR